MARLRAAPMEEQREKHREAQRKYRERYAAVIQKLGSHDPGLGIVNQLPIERGVQLSRKMLREGRLRNCGPRRASTGRTPSL
jgi:hypothetical protein